MTLVAANINVEFGLQAVLSGVDFAVSSGEVVGLIGPNGAGKSTLLQALAGLHPATLASVSVDGNTLLTMRIRERARTIAFLRQNTRVHWPLAAGQVAALGRYPHGGAGSDDEKVQSAMKRVEVLALRDQPMSTLSAGEQMRVHIARALAVEAPYLLADEPVAALDPYHQLECMELLRREAQAGTGVVVVLHDLLLAARFCDWLVLLDHGRIAATGLPHEVLHGDALQAVYGIDVIRQRHDGQEFVLPWRRRTR